MKKVNHHIGDAFGIPNLPAEAVVPGFDEAHSLTPTVNDEYFFQQDFLRDFCEFIQNSEGDGFFIVGPTGSGKSEGIQQVAARLNYPLVQGPSHNEVAWEDLVGTKTLIGGDIIFEDGPLTMAVRNGFWYVQEEMDALPPSIALALNRIVEGAPLTIPQNGGEVVYPHPEFKFIATGNTAGLGDDSGGFGGTQMQNQAFMDRFRVSHLDYPDETLEVRLLKAAFPEMEETQLKGIRKIAEEIRKLYVGQDGMSHLPVTMSTRVVKRWLSMALYHQSAKLNGIHHVHYALDRALAFRCDPASRRTMHEITQRVLGTQPDEVPE